MHRHSLDPAAPILGLSRHTEFLRARLRGLGVAESNLEDAMQDVFVQVLRHQRSLDDAAPSSLLFRLATNVCLNKLRTQKRKPEDRDDELVLTMPNEAWVHIAGTILDPDGAPVANVHIAPSKAGGQPWLPPKSITMAPNTRCSRSVPSTRSSVAFSSISHCKATR